MNILITGAGGYIGRNLAKHLAGQGHSVTALVTKSSAALEAIPNINIVAAPNYRAADWDGVATLQNHDVIIHTASRVHHSSESGEAIVQAYRASNSDLTFRLAKMAEKAGVKRFLFLSSIGAKMLEDQLHMGRTNIAAAWKEHPYRMSKLEAERALNNWEGALKVTCIRLPMVYGAKAPGSFSTLTRIIKLGVPLPFESFTSPRAFIAIDTVKDFVSFYLEAPKADGTCWSIRDGDEVSPLIFASETARAAQLPNPRFFPCPPWLLNIMASAVRKQQTARSLSEPVTIDLGPVQQKLGWQPKLTVAEGLKRAFS